MTPARPQLAAVLAALTDTEAYQWANALRFDNAVLRFAATGVGAFWRDEATLDWNSISVIDCNFGDPYPRPDFVPWITADVAFAWEVLQTRGLIPDGYVGLFACALCGGTGRVVLRNDATDYIWFPCRSCSGPLPRPTPHPLSMADIVSWASLGFAPSDDGMHPGILGAEEMARRQRPGVAVLWRVAPMRARPYLVGGFDMLLDTDLNIATLAVPPILQPAGGALVGIYPAPTLAGTIVFPAGGGLQMIDRDGNVVDITTNEAL